MLRPSQVTTKEIQVRSEAAPRKAPSKRPGVVTKGAPSYSPLVSAPGPNVVPTKGRVQTLRFSSSYSVSFSILRRNGSLKTTRGRPECSQSRGARCPLAPGRAGGDAEPAAAAHLAPGEKGRRRVHGCFLRPRRKSVSAGSPYKRHRRSCPERGASPEPRSPAPSASPSKHPNRPPKGTRPPAPLRRRRGANTGSRETSGAPSWLSRGPVRGLQALGRCICGR